MPSKLGIYGLSTMGQNLALNFVDKGISVSVYNRTAQTTFDFVSSHYNDDSQKRLVGFENVEDFVNSLEDPKLIILLVKSDAVEQVINQLIPLLNPRDTVLDMGNSFFRQSQSIYRSTEGRVRFVDCGISGGEEGARHGASFMLGGHGTDDQVLELLRLVSARKGSYACAEHFEGIGCGHFVKMVHNAIEYAIMQFLAELYATLVKSGYSTDELIEVFSELSRRGLNSYLLKISVDIFRTSVQNAILDDIEEVAGQKGTGKWTSQTALDYGIGVPCLTTAVESRSLSKVFVSNSLRLSSAASNKFNIETIEDVFKLALASVYDQAARLLRAARVEENFRFDLKAAFRVWQAGCILEADHLEILAEHDFESAESLFEQIDSEAYKFFIGDINQKLNSLRALVNQALQSNSYIPMTLAVSSYVFGLHTPQPLGFNLIQAQRDYFGKHGVRLKSSEDKKLVNIEWLKSE